MIERTQPAEVFTTTDGSVFLTAERAHTHEREERLFDLAKSYALKNNGSFSLTMALSELAVAVTHIVRSTPLAEPKSAFPLIANKQK